MNGKIDQDWRIYRGQWRASRRDRPVIGAVAAVRPRDRCLPGAGERAGRRRRESPERVQRAQAYRPSSEVLDAVNAAPFLQRPLLVTGKPGTGKSTLASNIAHELRPRPVLYWPMTGRSTLTEPLHRCDAIGWLEETNLRRSEGGADVPPDIGRYPQLGPLGTALFPWHRPRGPLVDELDKSDIDLPNELLNIIEEEWYDVPELTRLPDDQQPTRVRTEEGDAVAVHHGRAHCRAFPVVVITNNGEREFPPAFLRRCLRSAWCLPARPRRIGGLTMCWSAHDSVPMVIWRRNCAELRDPLERLGARNIRVLAAEAERAKPPGGPAATGGTTDDLLTHHACFSSTETLLLATGLAGAPLNLPVTRLVQQTMLSGSRRWRWLSPLRED